MKIILLCGPVKAYYPYALNIGLRNQPKCQLGLQSYLSKFKHLHFFLPSLKEASSAYLAFSLPC